MPVVNGRFRKMTCTPDGDAYQCVCECGFRHRSKNSSAAHGCRDLVSRAASQEVSRGPGDELKTLLAKFGIHASPTCKCNTMAKKMDEWGPDESLNHLEEIVDVMEETAKKRRLPFLRTAARLLVRRAISKSRAMINREQTHGAG